MDMLEDPFCVEIYRKNAGGYFPCIILSGNLQKKSAWTLHKGHLCGNLQEKCRPRPCPPGPTRAIFYSYRRNPFSVATLFREVDVSLGTKETH